MRADERAESALDTVVRIPGRNLNRDRALFLEGNAVVDRAVEDIVLHEVGYRQIVAFQRVDRHDMVVKVFVTGQLASGIIAQFSPFRLHFNFNQTVFALVDCLVVQLDDFVALLGVGLLRHVLHQLNRFFIRHDLFVQREECRLQDRVGPAAHADFLSDLGRVDDVELRVLLRQLRQHAVRQVILQFLCGERRVQ